jgi:hypothetical protein
MAELFQKDVRTINEHIRNIYEEGELEPEATIRKFRIVQTEGARQADTGRTLTSGAAFYRSAEKSEKTGKEKTAGSRLARALQSINHFL